MVTGNDNTGKWALDRDGRDCGVSEDVTPFRTVIRRVLYGNPSTLASLYRKCDRVGAGSAGAGDLPKSGDRMLVTQAGDSAPTPRREEGVLCCVILGYTLDVSLPAFARSVFPSFFPAHLPS